MGWGKRWPERQPRPKVQKLSDEQKEILSVLDRGIKDPPVLTALRMRARLLRGRFYIERIWPTLEGVDEEDYYTSPEDVFEKALALIKQNDLLGKFESRAYKIVKNATDSYGHCDTLQDMYEEVYGEFK